MGAYRYGNVVNQTEYTSFPRRRPTKDRLRPTILQRTFSHLGTIAMRADEILGQEIHAKQVVTGIKHIFPAPEKTLYQFQQEKLDELKRVVQRSNEVIARARTVWPLTLFRDDIVVDRTKITITKRDFFFVSEVMSIRLEDILNVKVSLGPFFGSLTLAVRVLSSEDHHTINYFYRKDAIHLKHIIQGYIIALHNNIDCHDTDKEQLILTLSELGHDNN